MATSTKRSVKRAVENKTKRGHNRGKVDVDALVNAIDSERKGSNVAPFIPKLTFEQWIASANNEDEAIAKSESATSHRIHNALLLLLNDANKIDTWSQHWTAYKSGGHRGATPAQNEAKATALEWFERDFRMGERPKAGTDDMNKYNSKRDRLLKSVQFCLVLRERNLVDAFKFFESGAAFLSSKSTLGREIWKAKKWNDDKDLVAAANDIQLVERSTVKNVAMSWIELQKAVLPKNVVKASAGTATPQQDLGTKTMDLNKPSSMMSAANDALAINSISGNTMEQQKTVEQLERTVEIVFNAPVFLEARMQFATAFKTLRDVLKMPAKGPAIKPTPQPIKGVDVNKIGGLTGPTVTNAADKFARKGDLATPESAKSLPHPNGPAAQAARNSAKRK